MGRKSSFCDAQLLWLIARTQRFRDAQEVNSTPSFFSAIREEFLVAFPVPPSVPEVNRETYKIDLGKRVKNWFYNRRSNSATLSGVQDTRYLDLTTTRPRRGWYQQHTAYMAMYPKTLQRRAEGEYQMHCDDRRALGKNPERSIYAVYRATKTEAGRKPKAAVAWLNERAKQALQAEADEIKERATHLAAQYNSGKIETIEPEPDDDDDDDETGEPKTRDRQMERRSRLDACIEAVPRSLKRALESFHEQTGWSGTFIVGGPQPREGGSLALYIFHRGVTAEFHNEWPGTDELFQQNVVESYKRFLQLAYPPELCSSFALASDGSENTKLGADVVVKDGTEDISTPVQVTMEPSQHIANERSKESKAKRRKRLADMDEETSGESDIELSSSDEEGENLASIEEISVAPRTIRKTPEERMRDANIRRNKALFQLRAIYTGQPEVLDKIDQAFFGFEVDMDDMDVANTILARAGLPSLDASAPDPLAELNAIKNAMEAQPSKQSAPPLNLPPRAKNPRRKVRFSDPVETGSADNGSVPHSAIDGTYDEVTSSSVTTAPKSVSPVVHKAPQPLPSLASDECRISGDPALCAAEAVVESIDVPHDNSASAPPLSQFVLQTSSSDLSTASDLQVSAVMEDSSSDTITPGKQNTRVAKGRGGHRGKGGARGRASSRYSNGNAAKPTEMTRAAQILSEIITDTQKDVANLQPSSGEMSVNRGTQLASEPPALQNHVSWVDSVVEALRPIWASSRWRNLLDAWRLFETKGSGDLEKGLPLTNAPIEVRSVVRMFETISQDYDLPDITSASIFSSLWWKWWLSCQPDWRLVPDAKPETPPKLKTDITRENTLKDLCYGGKKGLAIVVFGLALWANAREHTQQSNKSLNAAVADVSWVLKSLPGAISDSPATMELMKKRVNGAGSERVTKKSRTSS